MIEKLKNIPIDMNGKPSAVWLKINELVDTVNELHEEAKSNAAIRANHETKLDVIFKRMDLITYTKSMRMEKEFAEDEIKRLQKKLNRTQKTLEIAVNALITVRKYTAINQFAPKSREAHMVAKKALAQINNVNKNHTFDNCD